MRSPKQKSLDSKIETVREILRLKNLPLKEGGIVGLLKAFEGDADAVCGAILESCNGKKPEVPYVYLLACAKPENFTRYQLRYHKFLKQSV